MVKSVYFVVSDELEIIIQYTEITDKLKIEVKREKILFWLRWKGLNKIYINMFITSRAKSTAICCALSLKSRVKIKEDTIFLSRSKTK